jgi:hypothetical protein
MDFFMAPRKIAPIDSTTKSFALAQRAHPTTPPRHRRRKELATNRKRFVIVGVYVVKAAMIHE